MLTRTSSIRGAACVALSLVTLLCSTTVARADGVADEADIAFRLGADRYVAGDHRQALLLFLQSHRLSPNANVAFNVARAYEQLGRLADAHRWYVDALASASREDLRTSIRDSLTRLSSRVALLDVETTPAGATIYLERQDLGSVATAPRALAVEPGDHAEAPDPVPSTATGAEVEPSAMRPSERRVHMTEAPAPPPTMQASNLDIRFER